MIFKKEDIKIEMIATSLPLGRTVKIVNVYTAWPFFSSLQLLHETPIASIALVQVTVQRERIAQCFGPWAAVGWETACQALP